MRQIESFFWGIIVALGALFLQLLVYIGFSIYPYPAFANLSFSQLFMLPGFIIAAAAIEETFKYIAIAKRVDAFSQDRMYVINSFFVGLGFFATEFALISLSIKNIPLNSLGEIAIVHLGTAGIIGYLIAIKNPRKISTFFKAIIWTTIFHATYNLLIVQRNFLLNYFVLAVLTLLAFLNVLNIVRIKNKLA